MKKILTLLIIANLVAAPSFAIKLISNDDTDRVVPSRSSTYDDSYETDVYYINKDGNNSKDSFDSMRKQYQDQYRNDVGWLIDKARGEVVGGRWVYPGYNENVDEEITNSNKSSNHPDVTGKLPSDVDEINIHRKVYTREAADYYSVDIKNSGKGKKEVVTTPSGMIIDEVH